MPSAAHASIISAAGMPVGSGGGTSTGNSNGDPGTPTSGRPTANTVSYSSLTAGSDMSGTLNNGSGSIVSLAAGTYSFSDFTHGINGTSSPVKNGTAGSSTAYEYASGIQLVSGVRGLYGAGSHSTTIEMTPGSSNQANWVPAQGSGLTNGLYLADLTNSYNGFVWDGINFVGTSQGHLYNGIGMNNATNASFTNSTFSGIPGNAGSPPGETFIFSVHQQPSNSTVTFTNCTFDGNQNGTGVAAAMLGTNTTNGVITITDCLFQNNTYSAGVAIWELAAGATVNMVRPVMKNGHRNVGNEAQAGTINIYDPLFDDPSSGEDDIRITWTSNYNSGTINVYFTSVADWNAFIAPRTNKKILTICTVAQSYGGSAGGAYTGSNTITDFCHVYIGGVEQNLSTYWSFTGTTHN